MIDNIINCSKNGKASGLDGIMIEHVKHAHPVALII